MALRIIEGVPGSGKSYYSVRHLAKSFFVKQKDGSYFPDPEKPCCIITNIDGFKPDHLSLKRCIEDSGGDFRHFFSKDYQVEFSSKFDEKLVYVIDEAQMIFRKNDRKLNEVFSYFEWHRHLGHDIYLVTQNTRKLPSDMVTLVEYVIRAAPRVRSITGEFKYHWISNSEKIKTEAFRPDKGVFALYKSMDVAETEKIKNPLMKTVAMALAGAFIVGCGGIYYLKSKWTPDKKTKVAQNEQLPVNSSIVPTQSFKPTSEKAFHKSSLIRQRINFILTTSKKGQDLLLVFDGALWPIKDFPYPVYRAGSNIYADLPKGEGGSEEGAASDLSGERRSEPPSPPSRST
jgi:hypothetical protein